MKTDIWSVMTIRMGQHFITKHLKENEAIKQYQIEIDKGTKGDIIVLSKVLDGVVL